MKRYKVFLISIQLIFNSISFFNSKLSFLKVEHIPISDTFLLPDDPVHKASRSWSCHSVPYQRSSSCGNSKSSITMLPKSIKHKVDYKVVKEVIDKYKRLVSQTDRTDIKANLKVLGT